jgi:hypothetical protein
LQSIILGLAIFAFTANRVSAQQAKTFFDEHQYSKAIQTLLDKSADLSGLSDLELYLLGGAYMRRGHFLRDLAALQVRAGRDFYFERDTSKAARPLTWTPYFLGRYLFEQGQYEAALRTLQRAAKSNSGLSNEYVNRSRIWIGACQQRLGRPAEANETWKGIAAANNFSVAGELAYARWRIGQKSEEKCGDGNNAADLRCGLWSAARQNRWADSNKLQTALLNGANPDVQQKITADYIQSFYDPATAQILAYADFIAAITAFNRVKDPKGVDQANLFAGICAFEAGEYERSRLFLQKTTLAQRDIYLGAIDYLNGQRNEAEQKWRPLQNSNAQTELEWAEVASRFVKQPDAIDTLYQKHKEAAQDKMDLALRLGRSLMQINRHEEAVELMQTAYPEQYRDKLRYIEPAYLITLALAKYNQNARYYSQEILGHLNGVREAYPIALAAYDLAQSVFTPKRWQGVGR